jgi:hypothetical protein
MGEDILKVLDSLKDNLTGEINSQELINKLLFGDNTAYIDEFHASFKENFFNPVSTKLKDFYSLIKKKLDTVNNTTVDKLTDPFGLSNINKEYEDAIKKYKTNMEKFLNKKFEPSEEYKKNIPAIKQNKAGQYVDQNNRFVSNEVRDQFLAQQASAANPTENLNKVNQPIQNIIPDSVKNIKPNEPADQEQKNFGPQETLIGFSKSGKEFITDLLDNAIKKFPKISITGNNQEEQAKGGMSGLFLLLLGLISDGILLAGKLSKAFEWLFGLPERVLGEWEESFRSSKTLIKVSEWFGEKWNAMIDGIKRLIKFDDISAWVNTKWTNLITKIKEATNFDKIVADFTKGFEKLTSPIKSAGKFVEDAGKGIEGLFAEGGRFSGITKFFKGFAEAGEGLLSWISKIRGPFAGVIELFSKFAPLFDVLEKFLGPIALLIDPVVDSIKTLFSVFSDDKLSPIQKTTAVLMSFIGGFGDILVTITDWVAKLSSGAFSWLMGKGFKTENAVSKGLNNFTGGESLGVSLGKKTVDLEKESNQSEGGFFSNVWKGMTASSTLPPPTKEELQAGRRNVNNPIPTEDAQIDATYITGIDGKTYVPNSKADTVIATKSGGSIDKSINSLNKNVQDLAKAIIAMQKNNNNNNIPTSNNVSNVSITSNNGSKGSSRDPLHDMRVNWHAMTMKRGGVYC